MAEAGGSTDWAIKVYGPVCGQEVDPTTAPSRSEREQGKGRLHSRRCC